jgi:ABC-type Fe3+-hydroxamate transport system substrate-binding protein
MSSARAVAPDFAGSYLPGSGYRGAMTGLRDDTGTGVSVKNEVLRVVSLVPSLTESVAVTAPGLLVGATEWCTEPAGLDVTRIGGTKNPDTAKIIALRPDLVLANQEENRAPDIEALRAAGISVWVTVITTLDEAFQSLRRMLTSGCGLPEPGWIAEAQRAWDAAGPAQPGTHRRGVIPIWRRPWMVVGHSTFTGDVLARLGVSNVFGGHPERYPKVSLDQISAAGPDLVVLPDEPYAFSATDGPECFPGTDVALVSGRYLTWYGPSLVQAPGILAGQLAATRRP